MDQIFGMGRSEIEPSGFSPKSTLVDRFLTGPVDRFFTTDFCSLFNASNQNFSKGGLELSVKVCDSGRRFLRFFFAFAFFAKITQF